MRILCNNRNGFKKIPARKHRIKNSASVVVGKKFGSM